MTKPTIKTTCEPYWDYHEVRDYLEEISGKQLRNWANYKFDGDKSTPYQDFWHWVVDQADIHNGCYFYLNITYNLKMSETPEWVKEILTLMYQEFQLSEMRFWVEW